MAIHFRIAVLPVLLFASSTLWAWSNHTLITQGVAASIPEITQAPKVKVQSLEDFLAQNQVALAEFLEQEEQWMNSHLWHYAPRPAELAFKANGNPDDIVLRFKHAIRINPNAKIPLYLQHVPGVETPSTIAPNSISVFKDLAYLPDVSLQQLGEKQWVAPLDVVVSGSDEPDHGLDIGLFTDSNTEHGKIYGFGEQAFGNPNLEYGTQAPFHMGFYHESDIIYALAGFLKQSYPQYRIHLYKRLAEFAFKQGNNYWGYRFMGWGLHYIGDFSNPYHVTPVPGASTLQTLWLGVLSTLGIKDPQADAIQLVSNRHTALEEFQQLTMNRNYLNHDETAPMLRALHAPAEVMPYEFENIIDVFAKNSAQQAAQTDEIISANMPAYMVSDSEVEYSELAERQQLLTLIEQQHGQQGIDKLTQKISDLLSLFADNGKSYVLGILSKPQ